MRPLVATIAALALAAVLATSANAAIVPGTTIDGPSADVQRFGDIDVAPDGTGALAYVKKVGGVDHVFVSLLSGGAFGSPSQVDSALSDPSSDVSVAAANGGRVVVTFSNGPSGSNKLQSAIKPNGGSGFQLVEVDNAGNPRLSDVAMNPGGVGYVSYTGTLTSAADVFAARLNGTTWTKLANALDSTATNDAGDNNQNEGRPAVTPDGNAVVAWAENTGSNTIVFIRRLTGTTAGSAVHASVDKLDGHTSANSDEPQVDVDGSGLAWLVFREQFDYGGKTFGRDLARSFDSGGKLGNVQVVDGSPDPPTENGEFPRIDVNPGGLGLIALDRQNALTGDNFVFGSGLAGGTWSGGTRFDTTTSTGQAFPTAAIGDGSAGLVSWLFTDKANVGTMLARRANAGAPGDQLTLSDPALGSVGGQPESAADAAGNVAIGFEQGAAGSKRIVAALVDAPPGGGGGGGGTTTTTDTRRPVVSGLTMASAFYQGSLLARLTAVRRRIRVGTTIRFRVDEDSRTTLTFQKRAPGRRVGKRCLKPTRARRHRRRCTRYLTVRPSLIYTTKAGLRKVRFQGRLNRRKRLRPGPYRLTVVAQDAAGNKSLPRRKNFRLLKKPRRHR